MSIPDYIFKSVPLAICVWKDVDGYPVVYATQSIRDITGYELSSVLSSDFLFLNCVYEKDLMRLQIDLRLKLDEGSSNFTLPPYRIVAEDGSITWVEETIFKRFVENDVPYMVGYLRDISSFMDSNLFLRKIAMAADQSGSPIIITNCRGDIEYANNQFATLSGYSKDELMGLNTRQLRSENGSIDSYMGLWDTIMKGDVWKGELCNRRKDGSYYWDSTTITPIKDEQGVIVNFLAISEDVTDLFNSRDEINRKEKLLHSAAIIGKILLSEESLDDVINEALALLGDTILRDRVYVFEIESDPIGEQAYFMQRYEWVKEGVVPQLGNPDLQYVPVMPEYKRWFDILMKGDIIKGNVSEFPDAEVAILEEQDIVSIVVVPIWLENSCWGFVGIDDCRIKDNWSDGEIAILGSLASSIGMAIVKWRRKQELIKAKERAEESDRLKTAFLQNISHEIRTPMNGILGFIDLLNEDELSPEMQHEYLNIIKQSSNRLLSTVNDIINISKIEAGMVVAVEQVVNVNAQLEQLYKFFLPEIERKGMKLVLADGVSDRVARIFTDEEKLYAIISNLIKNAIKYSNSGTIEIGYNIEGENIVFYVKDEGIGIPKDRQKAIFDRFVQADITAARSHEGAGLGLSIVSAYVKMLNGSIWVESEIDKGSVFYVSLPYNTVKDMVAEEVNDKAETLFVSTDTQNADHQNRIELPRQIAMETSNERGGKILIVEDDEANVFYLKMLLQPYSYHLDYAANGKEAVDKVRREVYDLILMDVKMPIMDGHEATRQIRTFNRTIPIVAQTAFAQDSDRQEALDAGCDDYISKPCSRIALLAMVKKYINIEGV